MSLRNVSFRGNGYGESVCHSIPPPLAFEKSEYEKETSGTSDRELDFDLEPECFLSLFGENQNDKSQNIVSPQGGSKQQNTTKLWIKKYIYVSKWLRVLCTKKTMCLKTYNTTFTLLSFLPFHTIVRNNLMLYTCSIR